MSKQLQYKSSSECLENGPSFINKNLHCSINNFYCFCKLTLSQLKCYVLMGILEGRSHGIVTIRSQSTIHKYIHKLYVTLCCGSNNSNSGLEIIMIYIFILCAQITMCKDGLMMMCCAVISVCCW